MCTMHRPMAGKRADNSSAGTRRRDGNGEQLRRNICPAGFRCSTSAAEAMLTAGWQHPAHSNTSSVLSLSTDRVARAAAVQGICVPCQIGKPQHMPRCVFSAHFSTS